MIYKFKMAVQKYGITFIFFIYIDTEVKVQRIFFLVGYYIKRWSSQKMRGGVCRCILKKEKMGSVLGFSLSTAPRIWGYIFGISTTSCKHWPHLHKIDARYNNSRHLWKYFSCKYKAILYHQGARSFEARS